MDINALKSLLDPFDALPLECDGHIRVVDYVLHQHGIVSHVVKSGLILNPHTEISFWPHFWIEVDLGAVVTIIDYRAKMWLGNSVPHGVFPANPNAIIYEGEPAPNWRVIEPFLYDVLITPFPEIAPVGRPAQ